MGLFSLIGGILGGGSAKKAVKKATQQQVDALNAAIAEQHRQFDITDANFKPYRDIGGKGLASFGDLVGVNGAPQQQSAIDVLKASPFYQSLFRNGQETLLQNASATGGLRGGNTERGLADFGADTLMQTIQQQLASLSGLAGMGMGATNAVANFGQQASQNVQNDLIGQGQARASGSLARGGLNAQMWNNAGSFLDQAVQAAIGAGAGAGGAPFSLGKFIGGF
jgi:hypothetical protein